LFDFYLIPRTNDETIGCNIIHEVEEAKAGDGVEMQAMVKKGTDRNEKRMEVRRGRRGQGEQEKKEKEENNEKRRRKENSWKNEEQ
jgi:hypothetical protein